MAEPGEPGEPGEQGQDDPIGDLLESRLDDALESKSSRFRANAGNVVVAASRLYGNGSLDERLNAQLAQSTAYEVEDDDIANDDEEENFEAGMRQNAADYQEHDADGDQKLDFDEFCALVRDREIGEHTDEELRERFEMLDSDQSGQVDMSEYVLWSLRDALSRSSARVIDLFRQWDVDQSGEIDKKEFRQAVQAMGFDFGFGPSEIDRLFDEIDADNSGKLDYKELNKHLRKQQPGSLDPSLKPGAAGEITTKAYTKHKLRRKANAKGTSLVLKGEIDISGGKPVAEQLRDILSANAVRVIDLFREWDEDGSGDINRAEFVKGVKALGVKGSKEELNHLFAIFDQDGGGKIEYSEMNKLLRRGASMQIDDSLKAGAKGTIELKAKNKSTRDLQAAGYSKRSIKKVGQPITMTTRMKKGAEATKAGGAPKRRLSVIEMINDDLYKSLTKNAARLQDLFQKWDADGDGTVNRKEWAEALPLIGIRTSRENMDKLFDEIDADGDGHLEYAELRAALKRRTGTKAQGDESPPLSPSPVRNESPQPMPPMGRQGSFKSGYSRASAEVRDSRSTQQAAPAPATTCVQQEPSQQPDSAPHKQQENAAAPAATALKEPPRPQKGSAPQRYSSEALRGENPFKAMELALEAAPMSLRVIGMSAADNWGAQSEDEGQVSTGGEHTRGPNAAKSSVGRQLFASTGQIPTVDDLSVIERALQSQLDDLDGIESHGFDAGAQARLTDPTQLQVAELKARRSAARELEAKQEEEKQRWRAAIVMQSCYRRFRALKDLSGKGKSRVWKFHKFHNRWFSSEPGTTNLVRFHVHSHETLQIVSVVGSGRLLLDAIDPHGNVVVQGGVVYDSSANLFLNSKVASEPSSPSKSTGAHYEHAAPGSLWSAPGEYDYAFRSEPLEPKGTRSSMHVKFRIEMMLTGHDLVAEPPTPPGRAQHVRTSSLGNLIPSQSVGQTAAVGVLKTTGQAASRSPDPIPVIHSKYVQRKYGMHLERIERATVPAEATSAAVDGVATSTAPTSNVTDAVMREGYATRAPTSSGADVIRSRADEVSDIQSRAEQMREAQHLSQLDARSHAQLKRATSLPQLADQQHQQRLPYSYGYGSTPIHEQYGGPMLQQSASIPAMRAEATSPEMARANRQPPLALQPMPAAHAAQLSQQYSQAESALYGADQQTFVGGTAGARTNKAARMARGNGVKSASAEADATYPYADAQQLAAYGYYGYYPNTVMQSLTASQQSAIEAQWTAAGWPEGSAATYYGWATGAQPFGMQQQADDIQNMDYAEDASVAAAQPQLPAKSLRKTHQATSQARTRRR